MSTLEARIRAAAIADATLLSYLGDGNSPPYFRWFDTQLPEGSAYPSLVVQLIGGSETYVSTGRLPTGFSRMQFTIWDTDPEEGRAIEAALLSFLDSLNLVGITGLPQYPNYVVLKRQGMEPQSEPPLFQRIVDAMIFSDSSV